MQDRPALFSTFMMWLLASLYESLPEVGDPEKPKLVFFFDEAHLLFRDANKTFMQQIELVARLIRSKGVGVFFVTHSPSDVPAEVLGQLGNRVQHALRAFTPDDLEVVRATAETFPTTELYDVEEELTALGTGEALITALDLKGRPMPTVRTMMRPPHVAHGPGRAGRLRRAWPRHRRSPRPTPRTPTPNRPRSCSPRAWPGRGRGGEGADGGRRAIRSRPKGTDATDDAPPETRRRLGRRGHRGRALRALRDVQHDPAHHPRGPEGQVILSAVLVGADRDAIVGPLMRGGSITWRA